MRDYVGIGDKGAIHRVNAPKYDIHADPVWYCRTCHKLCGDGRNGTCVQFVIDCTCPNCGEQVKAWTCHYCK